MIVLDIMDGDFNTVSILDGVKIALYVVCLILLIQDRKEDGS